jgi:hypothetical protein
MYDRKRQETTNEGLQNGKKFRTLFYDNQLFRYLQGVKSVNPA